jgi:hypothetical protein
MKNNQASDFRSIGTSQAGLGHLLSETTDLEQPLLEAHARYNDPEFSDPSILPHIRKHRSLFAAIGLLAYGQLEMVEEIIDNLPAPPTDMEGFIPGHIEWSLRNLLPLPTEFDSSRYLRTHREELKTWVGNHYQQLIWDDDQGRYLLNLENSSQP